MDYYSVLGVDQNASAQELKDAFRKKAMQYHPDRNPGDPEAESKFKEINIAYETLKDPDKRREHDVTNLLDQFRNMFDQIVGSC